MALAFLLSYSTALSTLRMAISLARLLSSERMMVQGVSGLWLREKVSEMRTLGLPVPKDLLRFVDQLEQEEADDMFDNMPV